MRQNLYYLYEEDVLPERLSSEELETINKKYDGVRNCYLDNDFLPKVREVEMKIEAYLDAYAKKVGFSNYKEVSVARLKDYKTPEEIVALRKFNAVFDDEQYVKLHQEKNKVYDAENKHYNQNRQDRLYEILQKTCKQVDQKDAKGNPLPDNEEWLLQYNEEAEKLKKTAIGKNYGEELVQYHIGMNHCHFGQEECNVGVMPLVESLRNAGYEVMMFRSGMVQDWPYSRYTQDDPAGRYKAGDHMFWGTNEPMARLRLLDKDYNQKVLAKIAEESGLRMDYVKGEECNYFDLRFPAARDGSSMKELLDHFAMKMGISSYAADELKQQNPQLFHEVVDEHGGYAIYTDEMLKCRLNNLTARLVNQVARVNRSEKAVDVGPLLKDVDMGQMFREFVSLAAKQMGPEKTMELLNEAKENAIKQQLHVYMDTTDGGLMVLTEKDAGQLGILEEGRYIDLTERIDKVNVYQNHEGNYMVRCRIDGHQQMGRPLGEKQLAILDQYNKKSWNDLPKLVIAGQVYADTVIQMNGMNREKAQGRSL